MINIREYLAKHKTVAVGCNEASRLGKDWFILTLGKNKPYYKEKDLTEYAEISEVRKMIIAKELVVEHISEDKDLTIYVLKGKHFKITFDQHKNKQMRLEK